MLLCGEMEFSDSEQDSESEGLQGGEGGGIG